MVNLLSALFLFCGVVLFQEPIYNLLGIGGIKNYPLYCVVEPYRDGNVLMIDLFIVNRTPDGLAREDLKEFIATHASEDQMRAGPDIRVVSSKGIRLEGVEKDQDLNGDKGEASWTLVSDGKEARFVVNEIGPMAILRYTITTNASKDWTRDAKATLRANGIKVEYAGE